RDVCRSHAAGAATLGVAGVIGIAQGTSATLPDADTVPGDDQLPPPRRNDHPPGPAPITVPLYLPENRPVESGAKFNPSLSLRQSRHSHPHFLIDRLNPSHLIAHELIPR